MWKYLESNYNEISNNFKDQFLKIQNSCLNQIKNVNEKAEKDINTQTSELKREFIDKLNELHEK